MGYLYSNDWLRVFQYMQGKGWGNAAKLKFLSNFHSTEEAFNSVSKLINIKLQLMESHEIHKIRVVSFLDDDYPKLLREIANPPAFLFIKGNDLNYNQNMTVSIIGSRDPTPYGEKVASILVKYFRHDLVTIVSGMANGIDSIAQSAALQENMNTIAVLGTGVDICYPANKQDLYEKIIRKGTLLSEFLPGTKAKPHHFPMRNRIISGLSKKLIVAEAGLKSGTMITAQYALEQNRDVYAIPGSIFMENSQGCHQLINDGAKIVMNLDELDRLNFENPVLLSDIEEKIVKHISYFEPDIHELVNYFRMSLVSLLRLLGELQKKGYIRERNGHYISGGKIAR